MASFLSAYRCRIVCRTIHVYAVFRVACNRSNVAPAQSVSSSLCTYRHQQQSRPAPPLAQRNRFSFARATIAIIRSSCSSRSDHHQWMANRCRCRRRRRRQFGCTAAPWRGPVTGKHINGITQCVNLVVFVGTRNERHHTDCGAAPIPTASYVHCVFSCRSHDEQLMVLLIAWTTLCWLEYSQCTVSKTMMLRQ